MKANVEHFIDKETGNKVIQWTNSDANDQHLYFTSPSITDDNKYLVILSERTGEPNLFYINRSSYEIKQISNSKGLLRSYTYPQGKDVGLSKASPFLDSANNIVYWIEDDAIWKYTLAKSEPPQKIELLPQGWLSGYTDVSSNGQFMCIPCTDPRAFSGDDKTQHDQLRTVPLRMVENGFKSKLIVVDLQTKKIVKEHHLPFWCTHVQFHPTDFSKILCNSEGGVAHTAIKTYPYWGRIWVAYEDGSFRRLFNQKQKEYVNHENWQANSEAIIYHGKLKQTIFKKTLYYGFKAVNKFISPVFSKDYLEQYFNHFVASRDENGKLLFKKITDHPVSHAVAGVQKYDFIVDSRDGYLYKYEHSKGDFIKSVICKHNSSMQYQDSHPHPKISHDSRSILFTSDRLNTCNVYEVEFV